MGFFIGCMCISDILFPVWDCSTKNTLAKNPYNPNEYSNEVLQKHGISEAQYSELSMYMLLFTNHTFILLNKL